MPVSKAGAGLADNEGAMAWTEESLHWARRNGRVGLVVALARVREEIAWELAIADGGPDGRSGPARRKR